MQLAPAPKISSADRDKKAEGTAVVYRSKFGSPMSQIGL
jgi:hypothetical protein